MVSAGLSRPRPRCEGGLTQYDAKAEVPVGTHLHQGFRSKPAQAEFFLQDCHGSATEIGDFFLTSFVKMQR